MAVYVRRRGMEVTSGTLFLAVYIRSRGFRVTSGMLESYRSSCGTGADTAEIARPDLLVFLS